jgi:hypothetical protein
MPTFFLTIWDQFGIQLIHMNTRITNQMPDLDRKEGFVECTIDKLPLPPGRYSVNIAISAEGPYIDRLEGVVTLDVTEGGFFPGGTDTRYFQHGKVLVPHQWRHRSR